MPERYRSNQFDLFLLVFIGFLTGFAVLGYGLTTAKTLNVFDGGVAVLVLVWALGLAIQRRLPAIRFMAWFLPVLILIYGWTATGNAKSTHTWDGDGGFLEPISSWGITWLFGTVDFSRSFPAMIRASTMAGGFFVIVDLCRSRTNRRWLMSIVALVGLTVALIGIFQKAAGAQTLLFSDTLLTERRFFGPYRYHGNAATLLNFAWPVAAVLLLRAKIRELGPGSVAIWGVATVFSLAAVFVNTSKMGQVLGLAMIPLFVLFYRKAFLRLIREHPRPLLAGFFVGFIILGLVVALLSLSFSTSLSRWEDFGTSFNSRIETYETCLLIVPKSGWWGLGPGVFSTVFPYYATEAGQNLDFFWHTAHQDYLQTVIEWGYVGLILWGSLLGVALAIAARKAWRGDFYMGGILVGLLAAMIQAGVDFPFQIGSLQWVIVILVAQAYAISAQKPRNVATETRECSEKNACVTKDSNEAQA